MNFLLGCAILSGRLFNKLVYIHDFIYYIALKQYICDFFLFLSHSKIFTYPYSMVCEVLIWGLQQVQNEFEELRL